MVTLSLLVVFLLAFLHLITYFLPSGGATEDFNNIPEFFVEAIRYRNETNYILDRAGRGLEPENYTISEIHSKCTYISKVISEFRETLREGDLAEKLRKASISYEKAAESAALTANSSRIIALAFKKTEKALTLAASCEIDASLDVWKEAEPIVLEAIAELESMYNILEEDNSDYLLSEKHVEIYDRAVELTSKLLSSLREAYKTMELVEEYSAELKELCKGGVPCGKLKTAAIGLNPGAGGRFGYLIASIKSKILSYGARGNGGNGVGGGAGYTPPSSDD